MAYFSKLPGKKAACEVFSELQLDGQGPREGYSLRGAETFWYVLMCLAFGGGYFAKVWAKKALWEVVAMVQSGPGEYAEAISRALSGPATLPDAVLTDCQAVSRLNVRAARRLRRYRLRRSQVQH